MRKTVLVVDDDSVIRELAVHMFFREGYEVFDARNGEEALAILRSHPGEIHAVFTDIEMPVMNGIELAAEVHASFPNVAILFSSGRGIPQLKERYGDIGPITEENFIQKPFLFEKLAARMKDLLRD